MARARVTQHAEKVLAALEAALEERTTETTKGAAEAIVGLRRQFKYDGRPDWAGRSGEYRDTIERLYREAGVGSDSEGNFQANLRYHIGNVVRQVAPTEELIALGLAPEGPLGRVSKSRAERPRTPRRRPVQPGVGSPEAMASLALAAVRSLATMPHEGDGVEPVLRELLDEVLDLVRPGAG